MEEPGVEQKPAIDGGARKNPSSPLNATNEGPPIVVNVHPIPTRRNDGEGKASTSSATTRFSLPPSFHQKQQQQQLDLEGGINNYGSTVTTADTAENPRHHHVEFRRQKDSTSDKRPASEAAWSRGRSGTSDTQRGSVHQQNTIYKMLQKKAFEHYYMVAYTLIIATYFCAFCEYLYLRMISLIFPEGVVNYQRQCEKHANETVVRNEFHFSSTLAIFIAVAMFQVACFTLLTLSSRFINVKRTFSSVISLETRIRNEMAFTIRRAMFVSLYPTFFVYSLCSVVIMLAIFYMVGLRDQISHVGSLVIQRVFDGLILLYFCSFPLISALFHPEINGHKMMRSLLLRFLSATCCCGTARSLQLPRGSTARERSKSGTTDESEGVVPPTAVATGKEKHPDPTSSGSGSRRGRSDHVFADGFQPKQHGSECRLRPGSGRQHFTGRAGNLGSSSSTTCLDRQNGSIGGERSTMPTGYNNINSGGRTTSFEQHLQQQKAFPGALLPPIYPQRSRKRSMSDDQLFARWSRIGDGEEEEEEQPVKIGYFFLHDDQRQSPKTEPNEKRFVPSSSSTKIPAVKNKPKTPPNPQGKGSSSFSATKKGVPISFSPETFEEENDIGFSQHPQKPKEMPVTILMGDEDPEKEEVPAVSSAPPEKSVPVTAIITSPRESARLRGSLTLLQRQIAGHRRQDRYRRLSDDECEDGGKSQPKKDNKDNVNNVLCTSSDNKPGVLGEQNKSGGGGSNATTVVCLEDDGDSVEI